MRLLFLTLLLLSQVCSAQNVPSSGEIASKLAPLSRSMSTEVTPRGIAIPDAKPDEPPSMNLNINFEFDSALLTAVAVAIVCHFRSFNS